MHPLKNGLDQDAGYLFPFVFLNLNLAIFHRAAGTASVNVGLRSLLLPGFFSVTLGPLRLIFFV